MSPIIRGGLRVVGQRQRYAVATFGMYIRRVHVWRQGTLATEGSYCESAAASVREDGVRLWWMSPRTAVDKLYLGADYPADRVNRADAR